MGVAWALGAIVSDERAGDVRDERRFAERVVSWWADWLNRGRDADDCKPDATRGRRRQRAREREMHDRGARVFV